MDYLSDEEMSFSLSNLNEEILKTISLNTNGHIENRVISDPNSTKISFSIPDEKVFQVCSYSFSNSIKIPIKGNYSQKAVSDNEAMIQIDLYFLKELKNCIKDIKIQLILDPFQTIRASEVSTNHGKVEIIQSQSLLWYLQSKFC